jgi:hypothetical protein
VTTTHDLARHRQRLILALFVLTALLAVAVVGLTLMVLAVSAPDDPAWPTVCRVVMPEDLG